MIHDACVPLLIGVVGHRDLRPEDEQALAASFRMIVRTLRAEAPHTPLVLLSGLSPGAACLAADVALAEDVCLIACLPSAPERYRREFSDTASARFEQLLAAASDVRIDGDDELILHYAQVFVAFWDGVEDSENSTAAAVRLRRHGPPHDSRTRAAFGAADLGAVYHIWTPHEGNSSAVNVGQLRVLEPGISRTLQLEERESDRGVLKRIERFNEDSSHVATPSGDRTVLAPTTVQLEEVADTLASRFQAVIRRVTVILFSLAFLSAMAVTLVPGPIVNVPLAGIKIAGIALAFAIYFYARRSDFQNRHQDYRALAEGLRVQAAWSAFGLRDAVYRSYLRFQLGELRWIREVLKVTHFFQAPSVGTGDTSWVGLQRHYFQQAALFNDRKRRRVGVAAGAAGILSLCSGIALLLLEHALKSSSLDNANVRFVLSSLITAGVAAATLTLSYAEFRGFADSGRRYARMYEIFELAEEELASTKEPEARAEIMRETGREALAEQAQWLVLRRQRPIQVVRAG
jgi:hypothetical protein